jgi:heat shock protein HslJ
MPWHVFCTLFDMNTNLTLCVLALGLIFSRCSVQSPNMLSNRTFILKGSKTLQDSFPAGYPSLTFTDSSAFSGFSGCNRIFGSYNTKDKSIVFSNMVMTKMFCVNVAEDWFIQNLETIDSYNYKDSLLQLYHKDKLLFTFQLQSK